MLEVFSSGFTGSGNIKLIVGGLSGSNYRVMNAILL
jgi:hypothetical protein